MGTWLDRKNVISAYIAELRRFGLPPAVGPLDSEVLFILDGVGGFQAAVLMVRLALRQLDAPIGTVFVRWQVPVTGSVLPDLMWYKRNRRVARELATRIRDFRSEHPTAVIHVIAYSGGAGIAVFTCEELAGDVSIETLILACPAMSPAYNLAPGLRSVQRCYALVSHRDRTILGLGTRLFGTTDRRHTAAAGCVGFRVPPGIDPADVRVYERMREVHWSPELADLGHHGGHTGWGSVAFLREHLVPLLRGRPVLRTTAVPSA